MLRPAPFRERRDDLERTARGSSARRRASGSEVAPSRSSSASSSRMTRSASWMAWMSWRIVQRRGAGATGPGCRRGMVHAALLDRQREQSHERPAAALPAGRVETRLRRQGAGQVLREPLRALPDRASRSARGRRAGHLSVAAVILVDLTCVDRAGASLGAARYRSRHGVNYGSACGWEAPRRLIEGSLSNVSARKGRKIHTSHGQHYRYRARSGVVRARRCPPVPDRDRGRRGTPHDRVRGLADARRGPRRDAAGGAARQAFPAQRADRGLGPSRRSGRRRRRPRARCSVRFWRPGSASSRILTPPQALALLAASRPRLRRTARSAGLRSTSQAAAIAIVHDGELLFARTFEWSLRAHRIRAGRRSCCSATRSSRSSRRKCSRGIAAVRADRGLTVEAAVTCGDLPDLRSLTMPLIEELDLEVETLDSTDGLRAVGKAKAERFAESAPRSVWPARLALAPSKRRGSATRSVARIAAAVGVISALGWGSYALWRAASISRPRRCRVRRGPPRPGRLPPRRAPPREGLQRPPAARRAGPGPP